MKYTPHHIFMILLYLAGFSTIAYLAYNGSDYYQLSLSDRTQAQQHDILRPGGLWGHTYGIIGSSMMLLLFLYSVRKREWCGICWGDTSKWLNIHIWLGIMGPLFITLHSAGKFGTIVMISYYSMVLVSLSGFFGRYIYMQIPRDERGLELTLDEISTRIEALGTLLHDDYYVPDSVVKLIDAHSGGITGTKLFGWRAVMSLLLFDLERPLKSFQLRRHIRKFFPDFPKHALREIVTLAKKKAILTRRRALLGTLNSVFHYWHVFHKPFALVMIVIMLIHVILAILMGYTWIF